MKADRGANDPDPAQQVFHSTGASTTAFAGETDLEGLGRVARVHEEHGQRRHRMVLFVPTLQRNRADTGRQRNHTERGMGLKV